MGGLTLGRRLGRGAFGTVVEAEDERLGPIAVKVLPWRDDLPEQLAAAQSVSHPHLLRLHEVRRDGNRGLILMERIDGLPILERVRPAPTKPGALRPTLPLAFGQPLQEGGVSAFTPIEPAGLAVLIPALRGLVSALDALHRTGKVHRDVRPENVMLTHDDRVVLIDFGMLVEEGTHDELAGAPAYMAPDETPSAASDWYELGVLIFEALTGALPFAGTAREMIVRKQTVSAPSPSFVVTLPPEAAALDALCVKLLRRASSLRPTAEEIAAALVG